jgi:NAD-dependent DNA ligase
VNFNPFSFMALILLVMFTVVLASLTVVKSNQVRSFLEGDPDQRDFKTNAKLREEVNQLTTRVAVARENVELREREIRRLDLELAKNRIHLVDNRALGSITLPAAKDLEENPATALTGTKDSTWKFTSDLISASVKRMEALKGKLESKDFQENPALEEAVRKRQQELQDITKKISDDEAAFAKDREDLTKRLDDLTAGKDKADKQRREDFSRRATRVAQHEDKIRQLLELELKWVNELDADGSIAETAANEVIINLGAKDKVFPGLIFAVFNHDKGRYVAKGMIETIEVRDAIAVCRILKLDDVKLHPIGRGDLIGNPVFDSHHPKIFYVAGEFKRYNKEDIEHFIRVTGGVVAKVLGPDCDFLVAGERSEREQANARQFQILALKEDDLLTFVQKSFTPKK